MKITGVEYIPLACPLPEPVEFSLGRLEKRYFALVRVRTDTGLEGWGETFVNFPFWAVKERKVTVEEAVAPLLLGEDPLGIRRLWQKVYRALRRLGLQWGAPGLVLQALSGVDMALWDLLGKTVHQPVCQLLGGPARTRVPLYATGFPLKNAAEGAERCVAAGYGAVKLRMGLGRDRDLSNLEAVRRAVGDHVELLVDANMAWTLDETLELLPALEEARVGWLEEPVPYDDVAALQEIARRTSIPLAGGENSFGVAEFRRWWEAGVPRIWMPDPTRAGGVTETLRILHLAESVGAPVSMHHYGTEIGFAAAVHLMSVGSTPMRLLRDVSDTPAREEVVRTPVGIESGEALVPTGPGLGVEPNLDAIERYRLAL